MSWLEWFVRYVVVPLALLPLFALDWLVCCVLVLAALGLFSMPFVCGLYDYLASRLTRAGPGDDGGCGVPARLKPTPPVLSGGVAIPLPEEWRLENKVC
jgi:hypothetical protein